MLKQDTYTMTAYDFGCAVGVAKITGYSTLKESKNKVPKEEYKQMDEDLIVNDIINIFIEEGSYQQCMRKVLVEEKKRNGKTKKVTIYKKIIDWYDNTTH
jgi:hypothetical protein